MTLSLNKIEYVNKVLRLNKISFCAMEEDIFAKSRNGHPLKDTFDKENNSLDIYSNGLYPSNVLSNLAKKPFVFDGIECSSIEGFLQSLKTKDVDEQKTICMLYGGSAKKMSSKNKEWKTTGVLYWQGQPYNRDSEEYYNLIHSAFLNCYMQNAVFRTALDGTKGIILTHLGGKNDKNDTILTSDEFTEILTDIRDNQ